MITFLIVLGYILFVLTLIAGVIAVMFGLPGIVLIFADGIIFAACTHWERPSWGALLAVAVLALLAETSDNLLSMVGTRYGGGSGKAGWVAMLGGITGAILGSLLSPLFGSIGVLGGIPGFILGVVLVPLALAIIGGYCAVYWYELKEGRPREEAQQAAKGALLGRLLGVLSKTLLATIMSSVLLWAVFVPLLHR